MPETDADGMKIAEPDGRWVTIAGHPVHLGPGGEIDGGSGAGAREAADAHRRGKGPKSFRARAAMARTSKRLKSHAKRASAALARARAAGDTEAGRRHLATAAHHTARVSAHARRLEKLVPHTQPGAKSITPTMHPIRGGDAPPGRRRPAMKSPTAEERDKLPEDSFAGPGRSYPITDQDSVEAAARLLGKAPEADRPEIRERIVAIAKRKGFSLPAAWEDEKSLTGEIDTDTLIVHGGEVKALGNGKVGGWLVVFGDPDATDLSPKRDFFTKDTDFGGFTKSTIRFNHGLDPVLGVERFGEGTIEVKDVGVWIEGQLKARADYEEYARAMLGLVNKKALSWSSGTLPTLVVRERQENGSNKILSWPLGLDASLTPTPAEPRASAVALKSIELPTFDALKGIHLGEHADKYAAMSAMGTLHHALQDRVAGHLHDDKKTADEKHAAIGACFDEYRDSSMKCIKAMTSDPTEIKAIAHAAIEGLGSGRPIAAHLDVVVAAIKGFAGRMARRSAARTAEGRPLSEGDLARIRDVRDRLDGLIPAPAETKAVGPKGVGGLDLYHDFMTSSARLSEILG